MNLSLTRETFVTSVVGRRDEAGDCDGRQLISGFTNNYLETGASSIWRASSRS